MASIQKPQIYDADMNELEITDLNDVFDETNIIQNKNQNVSIPGTTTAGNRVENTFGKTRTITLQGRHYGESYSGATNRAKISAFIDEIEAWINVGFQARKTYVSTLNKEYKVFCASFQYKWNVFGPEHIEYTLVLVEGGNFRDDAVSDIGSGILRS